MKLSEHLNKGFWALADRGLPFIYAVAQIIVARILSVEEFGTYVIFQVIFNMLFAFTDNFALQAIVKYGVEPDIDLEALVTATASLFLGFVLPFLIAFNLLAGPFSTLLGNPHLATLFPLLAVYVLASAPRVVFSKVLQMRFRMRDIFFVDLANFGVGGGLVGLALWQHRIQRAEDVIWITVITALLSSIVSLLFARKHLALRIRYDRSMFGRIKEFVRFQGATGVVSVLQQNIDSLAVSGFTGAAGAAAYGIAKSFYRVFDVMRDTVTLLVFPASSKYYSRGDKATVRVILEKAVGFLYLAVVPIAIILLICAPILFHVIYGTKFNASIPIFRILVGGSVVLPIQMVFISTMVGMGRVREMFRIITIGLSLNVACGLALLPTIGVTGAAIAFVVGNCVQALLSYRFIESEIGFRGRDTISQAWDDAKHFVTDRVKK